MIYTENDLSSRDKVVQSYNGMLHYDEPVVSSTMSNNNSNGKGVFGVN